MKANLLKYDGPRSSPIRDPEVPSSRTPTDRRKALQILDKVHGGEEINESWPLAMMWTSFIPHFFFDATMAVPRLTNKKKDGPREASEGVASRLSAPPSPSLLSSSSRPHAKNEEGTRGTTL